MLSSTKLKEIVSEARPIIERQLDDAERIAGFRDMVSANGGDWSALKALIKAQIQDERDEAGDGKRVRKILDKAEYSTGYAELLGWSNMNEDNFSSDHAERVEAPSFAAFTSGGDEYHYDAETGEVTEHQPPQPAGSDLTNPQSLSGQVAPNSPETANEDAPVQDARVMTASVVATAELEPEQGVQISRPGPDGAGSSNGRTAGFDPVNAGSTPAPASKPLRPYCLNRANCGAMGRQHCWKCQKAHDDAQVPA